MYITKKLVFNSVSNQFENREAREWNDNNSTEGTKAQTDNGLIHIHNNEKKTSLYKNKTL